MAHKSHSPRKVGRGRLDPIDLDELLNSPSNRGMLSFLERPPEEATRRLAERALVNAAELAGAGAPLPITSSATLCPVGELPAEGKLLSDQDAQWVTEAVSNSPSGHLHASGEDIYSPTHIERASTNSGSAHQDNLETPVCNLPTVYEIPTDKNTHGLTQAVGNSPPHGFPASTDTAISPRAYIESADNHLGVSQDGLGTAVGILPTVGNSLHTRASRVDIQNHSSTAKGGRTPLAGIYRPNPVGNSPIGRPAPDTISGEVIGRRQKIRRALVAQDGHSSGEQLLYLSLWNAAKQETTETRLISIGYQGMSALCKLDKTNCKNNIQGLLRKLAVEITDTYNSEERLGTTYRIFSYREILRRREAAGMVWVVRTSGVRFVELQEVDAKYTAGNLPPAPLGNSPTPAAGDSPPSPLSNTHMGAIRDLPIAPVGKSRTHIGNIEKNEESSSSVPLHLAARIRSILETFDDDAVRQLWLRCRQAAPDCTSGEVLYSFEVKVNQLLKGTKAVHNPVGLLIWAVPKSFEGPTALYLQRREELGRQTECIRQEKEKNRAEWRAQLEDPRTPEDLRVMLRELLETESQSEST